MENRKKGPARQFELSKLNNSSESGIKDRTLSEGFKNGGRVSSTTQHIDTKSIQKIGTMEEVAEKLAKHRAARKLAGVIPFAGAGYAALQGDPAMAAEELAGDVPVVGQAYEAFKPEAAGQSLGEEMQMLAEDKARKAYATSPAHIARLKALQGFGR